MPRPTDAQGRLDALTTLTDAVCAEHLTDEYGRLAKAAAERLADLPEPPFLSGKVEGWACGIVRAIGFVNFLADPASPTHRRTAELAPLFGVSEATAAKRDREVRDALDLVRLDPHWTLPSGLLDNPMAWMLMMGGIPEDARHLPADVQRALCERDLIPFAPADPDSAPPTPRWSEPEDGPAYDPASRLDPDAPRLQLVVTLDDVSPPVTRTLIVPSDLPLDGLHEVIQTAMGWEDSHLHGFRSGRREIGRPDLLDGVEDERDVRVADVLPTPRARLYYTYDFGDDWAHTIRLEATLPPAAGEPLFACVGGSGACPPEDCGGPWGYADLLEALSDPDHPDHADLLDWVGGPIDPSAFDVEVAHRALSGG